MRLRFAPLNQSNGTDAATRPLTHLHGRVSVVVPALNEERGLAVILPELVSLAREHEWQVTVVDDGSTDTTAQVAAAFDVRLIRHPRRRGYGAALKTGIHGTDRPLVAMMDGDGQHRVSALRLVLEHADEAEMVVGARAGLSDTALWRRPGKWILIQLATYIAGQRLPDLNSGLRVIDRTQLIRYMHLCPDGFSFTTTLTLAFVDRGRSIVYTPIVVDRAVSRSMVSVTTGFESLLLILRLATLFRPLRLFVSTGCAFIVAGIAWAVPFALQARGVSIGAALLVLVGIQLCFAGLLADQIASLRKERFE